MKKSNPFDVLRTMPVVLAAIFFLAAAAPSAGADRLMCAATEYAGATCDFQGDIAGGSRVAFTCRLPSGDPFDKACIRLYSPIFGETITGRRGFNWQCDGGAVVHDTVLKDMKEMCTKLCGICRDEWK